MMFANDFKPRYFTPYGIFYVHANSVSSFCVNPIIALRVETGSKDECEQVFNQVRIDDHVRFCYRDYKTNVVYVYLVSYCSGPESFELTKDAEQYIERLCGKPTKVLTNDLSKLCELPCDSELYLNASSRTFVPDFALQLPHIDRIAASLNDNTIDIVRDYADFERIGKAIAGNFGEAGWSAFAKIISSSTICGNGWLTYTEFIKAQSQESMHFFLSLVEKHGCNPLTLKYHELYGK